jgi:hypothetical protein
MRVRRFVSGTLFVLGVYFFGMFLTAADGGPALADHLLYVLFGANSRADIDCTGGAGPLPCGPEVLKTPNGGIEIVDLSTTPPTLKKSIDLGASNPTSFAVSPNGKRIYFVDALNANVYFVDAATGAFLNTTPVHEIPVDCVLSPDGGHLYVTTREPSVVTIETTYGTVVGKVAPGQPYAEQFGGIAFNPGPDNKNQLAVAATSSAPAYYLFGASKGSVTLGPRIEVSGYCTDPFCGRADDIVYGGANRLLLVNILCSQLYSFALPAGTQISGGAFGKDACLPLNPHNSLLYSPLADKAYLVYRKFSLGLAPGMGVIDPVTFASFMISGVPGIPEAAAFAPGSRYLYIVSQQTFSSPFQLSVYDALTGTLDTPAYTFATFTFHRTAIDAKVLQASKVFSVMAGGLPFTGSRGVAGSLLQVGLLLFGVALLRLGRRR